MVLPASRHGSPEVLWVDTLGRETRFYPIFDFIGRDENTKVVVTQKKPMLVLARIDGSVDGEKLEPHYSTFVVFSISRGFLVTVMSREEKHRGHLGA